MVNATYIYNNTGFWNGVSRLMAETGYLFPDGLITVVFMLGFIGSSGRGFTPALVMGSFWGLVVAVSLWAGGMVDMSRPIFVLGVLLLSMFASKVIPTE